jgi:cephalosporin hydroxylase
MLARAFASVVDRQARRGQFTPDVLAAMRTSARQLELRKAGSRAPTEARARTLTPATERRLRQDLDRLPMVEEGARRKSPAVRGVVDAFHRLFYEDRGTWRRTRWQGIKTWKCPLDLWMYQEIIHRVRPGLIIETGTAFGGSAHFLGSLCDLVGTGRVVSIDIAPKTEDLPEHPRVTYVRGSSTDPAIVENVKAMAPPGEPVLVILDSDHREAHVRNELSAYADLVTPGSYVIVEDTNVNGHPAFPDFGPGPMEAVDWFLDQRSDFKIDHSMQRYHLTLNPRGFLKRRTTG